MSNVAPSNATPSYTIEETRISEFDQLSIAQLERSGDISELWVLNTSSGNNAGTISFTAIDDAGDSRGLEIPYTFVAINLADSMAPERVLRSNSFRRAVARGFLTIITAQRAHSQNSGHAAQVELNKIRDGISVGVVESAETMSGSSTSHLPKISVSTGSSIQVGSHATGEETIDPEMQVDSRIQRIMNGDDSSDEEKLNFLRSNTSAIKLVDALFISRCANADESELLIEASRKMIKTLKKRILAEKPNTDWDHLVKSTRPYARKAMAS